jgi:hypothetical protein
MARYRQEITVWDKCLYDQKNHIYITEGTWLLGFIPVAGPDAGKEIRFEHPKKQWSVSRRKFRDLKTKEIQQLRNGFFPS